MDIKFEDERLALIETDHAAETKLPVSVIQSARHRLNLIRAATDIQTMRNWKSLGYRGAGQDSDGEHTIAVNDDWEMYFRFDNIENSTKVTVIALDEHHLKDPLIYYFDMLGERFAMRQAHA
jgi:proteic killer suppression protein